VTGIAEMFAALDGYERYHHALAVWASERYADTERRAIAVDKTRAWRKANPEKARELGRRMHHAWKASNPEGYRAKNRRSTKSYRARHPEKVRAWNRKHQNARRARLKASAIGAAP
jgi:hypothetical protein